ncbi:uncharacterized protein LOC125000095 [Mugil cephalus]|uniref:uncharacterized protein LOC125000095 n=1 Tax=Mugil cephalus TaxID=48193 RepID=UPI001FB7E4EB|nr:uncharacterized protein LOC125000095 [Mugil cephalus]XP_047431425.1 uncharacterized protein LOC125000095 [Mugil cephalus]
MGFTAIRVLSFLLAFKLTTQELAKLIVSPDITAECEKQVTLNCHVSSFEDGLSIKYMGWFRDTTSLCFVNSTEAVNIHYKNPPSNFHCEQKDGQMSLVFQKVNPLEIGTYTCKMRSNKGGTSENTTMDLKECCGKSEGILTSSGPTCTFSSVYQDGDVHWFHGSRNLSAGSLRHTTSKSVDEHGWVTIRSSLEETGLHEPFNCSLRSTISDRYIASTLVENQMSLKDKMSRYSTSGSYGLSSQESTMTILHILILLTVTLN